jgi:hypothetical protein
MKYAADKEFYNNVIQYLVQGWQECSSADKDFVKNSFMLVTYVSIFLVKITVIRIMLRSITFVLTSYMPVFIEYT